MFIINKWSWYIILTRSLNEIIEFKIIFKASVIEDSTKEEEDVKLITCYYRISDKRNNNNNNKII